MMTPWQAVITLKDFALGLKKKYGKSFRVKLSAGHKLHDIIDRLRGNLDSHPWSLANNTWSKQ